MKAFLEGFLWVTFVSWFSVAAGSFLSELHKHGSLAAAFEAWRFRTWEGVVVSLGVSLLVGLALGWVPIRLKLWSKRKGK